MSKEFEQDIKLKGFVEYPPASIDPKWVIGNFQKKYTDDKGVKYFLTIRKWNMDMPYKYDYSTQLYKKGTHEAVNLEFSSFWTLEEVEAFIDTMFQQDMLDYYELYN